MTDLLSMMRGPQVPVPKPDEQHSTGDPPALPIRPWSSFLIRDYRLIFVAILCANTSMNMRNVTSLYLVLK
jgi:hypothetical protein